MNTANLQLEGLYLAIAAVNEALVESGAISRDQLGAALRSAETRALQSHRPTALSAAERDAIAFAPRLLQLASQAAEHGTPALFGDLAEQVGRLKP